MQHFISEEQLRFKEIGDPYGIRTHVTSVKGRCLNPLTNGPKYVELSTGIEPVTSSLPWMHSTY